MKYFLLFVLIPITIGIFFTQCENHLVDTSELQQIAADFNKNGPRMIDSETKIDAIEIKGTNTIVYKYTLVNLLVRNVDTSTFIQALKPGIVSIIKVSPEMKKLREQGTQFEYQYRDKENKFIYNFKISPADYGKDRAPALR